MTTIKKKGTFDSLEKHTATGFVVNDKGYQEHPKVRLGGVTGAWLRRG